jgi:hypothetical protein
VREPELPPFSAEALASAKLNDKATVWKLWLPPKKAKVRTFALHVNIGLEVKTRSAEEIAGD